MCRHDMQEQQSTIGKFDIPESTPVGHKVHRVFEGVFELARAYVSEEHQK